MNPVQVGQTVKHPVTGTELRVQQIFERHALCLNPKTQKVRMVPLWQLIRAAAALVLLFVAAPAFAGEVETVYTSVRYENPADVDDVLYRLTGKREGASIDVLDELVLRVQEVLDTYGPLRVNVIIKRGTTEDFRGEYNAERNEIVLYANDVTRGIFAHEVAHAVLCQTFTPRPSHAVQEAVAQVIDREVY